MKLLTDFINHLKIEGKSKNTIKAYEADLILFALFFLTENQKETVNELNRLEQRTHIDTLFNGWNKITPDKIKMYIGYKMQQGVTAKTISRNLSSLRIFYRYLLNFKEFTTNPVSHIKAPKQPSSLPKSLDVDLTQALLTPITKTWQDIRNQAIFESLYSSGLRVSECANLNYIVSLTQLHSGWLLILGKGNKERLVPIGKTAQKAINSWLSIRFKHAKSNETALFVNRFGKRLGVRSIQLALDKRTEDVALPTKMSPHRLRHACATHLLESSGDLRMVQEMLGHENLSTTQIYTKLDSQHLIKVFDKTHPRAKK